MKPQEGNEMMQSGNSSSKIERKLQERDRRMRMKHLHYTLASLLPAPQPTKLTVHDLLDQSTIYMKQLQERVETMKRRKEVLKCDEVCASTSSSRLPEIKITHSDSTVEVNLNSGLNMTFMLRLIINVLEEEGAEVITISYCTVGERVVYTIYSKAMNSRIGIETSRVHERLTKLVAEIVQFFLPNP